jgi:hypothetical protein
VSAPVIPDPLELEATLPDPLELEAKLGSNSVPTMSHIIEMTKGDTRPALEFHVRDDDGTAVNISGGTAVFAIYRLDEGTPLLSRSATIVDGPAGICRFAWQESDWNAGRMDAAGEYVGKLRVHFSDATKGSVFAPYEIRVVDPY